MNPNFGFPTGNKDVDLFLLSRLENQDLLNTLSLATKNKLIYKYLNDETFWRNRFLKKYPGDFEFVQKNKINTWKDFSLLLIKYLDLAKRDYEEGRRLFISNIWNETIYTASKEGQKDLIDFFIFKGANSWDWAMASAAQGGHRDLVDFFISQGAYDWDIGMYGAAGGGHRDLVDFFISQGADNWNWAMKEAENGNHQDLIELFKSKIQDKKKRKQRRRK